MARPEIVSGDDVLLLVQLKKDGSPFTITSASPVKARLVSPDRKQQFTGEIAQSEGAAGAQWNASLVVVQMSQADTAGISYQGFGWLEIQVHDGGVKQTWFVPVDIVKGSIA